MTHDEAYENAKEKVERRVEELEKRSREYSKKTGGNGEINYAYVTGALSITLIEMLAKNELLRQGEKIC